MSPDGLGLGPRLGQLHAHASASSKDALATARCRRCCFFSQSAEQSQMPMHVQGFWCADTRAAAALPLAATAASTAQGEGGTAAASSFAHPAMRSRSACPSRGRSEWAARTAVLRMPLPTERCTVWLPSLQGGWQAGVGAGTTRERVAAGAC